MTDLLRVPTGQEALELLPERLSPSRAGDFATCPALYKFKTIHKLPTVPTVATLVGTLSHLVLEKIFDFPKKERSKEKVLSLVLPAWKELESEETLRFAPAGSETEKAILDLATSMVGNWCEMERFQNFEPYARELKLIGSFQDVPLHGILDRIDKYTGFLEGVHKDIWVISDYKTGQVPSSGYEYEAFKPMMLYALLVKKQLGIDVDILRLVYVKTGSREKGIKQLRVTPSMLENAGRRMVSLQKGIREAALTGTWPAKPSGLCKSCSFVSFCPSGQEKAFAKALPS